MSRCLLAAFVCALTPLVTGTAIFFAWLWLRWDGFMFAGITTIYAGTACFGIGILCLLVHVSRSRRSEFVSSWQTHWKSVLAGVLLVANFPIAVVYTMAAIDVRTRYHVTVVNERDQSVDSFIVSGGGVHIDFGKIASRTTEHRSFHILGDGELSFQTGLDGVASTGTIDGYVTNGMGGSQRILIKPDGTIEVIDSHGT